MFFMARFAVLIGLYSPEFKSMKRDGGVLAPSCFMLAVGLASFWVILFIPQGKHMTRHKFFCRDEDCVGDPCRLYCVFEALGEGIVAYTVVF